MKIPKLRLALLLSLILTAMIILSGCGSSSPAASSGGGSGVPAGSKIYMTSTNSNNLYVVSNSTGQTIATIPLQGQGAGVAVNLKTKKAYVCAQAGTAVNNYVKVVDTVTNTVVATITLPPLPAPGGLPTHIAVDETQNLVYVSNDDGTMWIINGATDTSIGYTKPVTGNMVAALKVNPQTGALYGLEGYGNLYKITYDPATNKYASQSVASLYNGAFYQGTPAIDVDSTTNTIYIGGSLESSNGVSHLFVVDGNTNVITQITLPGNAPGVSGIAVDSAAKRAYLSSPGGNCLFIVDLTTNTVIKSVAGTASAIGVGIDPTDGLIGVAGVGVVWSYNQFKDVLSQAMNLPGNAIGITIVP